MKRLPVLLLAISLCGCGKVVKENCNTYRGAYTPFTVVPGIEMGAPMDSVLRSPAIRRYSVDGDNPSKILAEGVFVEDLPAHYRLYSDSLGFLLSVDVDSLFNPTDTAGADRILQTILGHNQRVYGSPILHTGYRAVAYEWRICDGLSEVIQYGASHEWADTATRWMILSISRY